MKKTVFKKASILIFFLSLITPFVSRSLVSAERVNADIWNEKVSIRNLLASYAYKLQSDSTADDVTSESGKYTFFVRHGYLGESRMSKYENVTYVSNVNSSYSTNDSDNSEIYQGWKISTSLAGKTPADGVICGMTAKEKMYFSADYIKIGGWPTNSKFNWYVQKSGETTYGLIKSVTMPSSADTASVSGLNRTILEAGDTVYWEFYYAPGGRNIQEVSGKLPIFNFTEYYDVPVATLTPTDYVAALSTNPSAEISNGLFSYTIKNSSIRDAGYGSATAGNLGTPDSEYYFTDSNLILKNGQKATIELTFIEPTYLQIQLPEAVKTTCQGLTMSGYLYRSSIAKTKQIYSTTYGDKFDVTIPQGKLLVEANDILYLEYSSVASSNIDTDLLPTFVAAQNVGVEEESDFPKFNPRDYSDLSEIGYATILKESARLNCAPISTKDFDISLLTGKVGAGGDQLTKFDFIHYNDGEYIDAAAETETASMYQGTDSFNAAYGAAAESYRVAFSDSNYVVFKILANKDTHLTVTHDQITGGWINGTSIYVWGYQKMNGRIVRAKAINLPNQKLTETPLEANYLSIEFDLKEGDTGYYVFGTGGAHNSNLNVTPTFTSDPTSYDEESRNSTGHDYTSLKMYYHDLVSETVQTKGEPLDYGLLTIALGHGSADNIQKMDVFTGTGNNDEKDTASTGVASSNPPKFWRWQMQCGKNDDAIISFKAGADTHLTIVWRKEAEITTWADHTALKTYAVDTDDFVMFDQAKLCVKEGHGQIDDTYYNYDVQLKKDQSFLICYSSMGANYGVIQYDFAIEAIAAEFDETKVFDFTAAKALSVYRNSKVEELRAVVNSLDRNNYSLVNWAYIEEAFNKFFESSKEAESAEKIDELFAAAVEKINSILTLEQEAEALAKAKEDAKKEAKEYLESKKPYLSKDHYAQAETLYNSFCEKVSKLTTVSKINIELIRIKAQIDQLCDVEPLDTKTIVIIACSIGGGVLILGGVALAIVLIIKNKKKNAQKEAEEVEQTKEE